MANNPVRPAKITPKKQYQTSEDDRIPWKEEGKMATRFYDDVKTPPRSLDTSGNRCYGDADLDMLKNESGISINEKSNNKYD